MKIDEAVASSNYWPETNSATVEAATIERCKQAVASWKIEADSLTISERAYNDVLDDAIRAIEALASQPAQPQAEVEVEAERLKQAIINIEGARDVARANFERHPDRKTVVHCWLQDIDVVLEALSTTTQAQTGGES